MSEEYINRETFLEDVKYIEKQLFEFGYEFEKEDVLRYLQTTCRVLKIVRCKDCVYRGIEKCFMRFNGADWTTDYGFCHIGREREDQNEQTTNNAGSCKVDFRN